jgi:hypothetical protein
MAASSRMSRAGSRAVLLVALTAVLLVPGSAQSQILPWEIAVAEIEAGRLRGLAEGLSKQNVLYQLHLGNVRKDDLVQTSERIDDILESLAKGDPAYSIPEPWTPEIRAQVRYLDQLWGPIRQIAVASPYQYLRVSRQFMRPADRRGDPLLLRYFDSLAADFIAESEKLVDLYDAECRKTGLEVCDTAATSGYATMIIERAAKQAVYVVAGIDAKQNRSGLEKSIEAYQALRRANDESSFYAAALDPDRGASASAARELLVSLRKDWDVMQAEFTMLAAGDEGNFDLRNLLETQRQLVSKVERLAAALVRYASVTYGS